MNTRESGKASSSLGLQDFDLLRVIGRGSYAKVLLVRLKKTDRIYAMKVVKKELVNDDEVSTVEFFYSLRVLFRENLSVHVLLFCSSFLNMFQTDYVRDL